MKRITIGSKPTSKPTPSSPDDWGADRPGPDEVMKRLTIDIPISLHQRVKSQCALRGETIADVVRWMLERRFKSEHRVEATSVEPATETQKHASVTFSNHDDDPTST